MIGPITDAAFPPRSDVSALLLAAGAGLRMGLGPKAFLTSHDRTLLEHAVDALERFAEQIVVGVCPSEMDRATALVGTRCELVVGGASRQETVVRVLARAKRPIVLLHEVARPFVTPELFSRVLAGAARHGAAALYRPLPPVDSLGVMDAQGRLSRSLPRNRVVSMQTPHAYRRDVLCAAHRQATGEQWSEDGTAAIVHRAGFAVHLLPGSEENIKLTFPDDLPKLAAHRRM